jgi:NADH-quinone oxidoreductase subunit M
MLRTLIELLKDFLKYLIKSEEITKTQFIKETGLVISICIYCLTNLLWIGFNPSYTLMDQEWWIQLATLKLHMSIDAISLFFVYLTSVLIPLCILFNWNTKNVENNIIVLLSIEVLLILVFQIMNLFFFYILFEAILIPFFIFIGLNGYRSRRIHAAYLLFFYTILGSFFMLITIFSIYIHTGSMDLDCLINTEWSPIREKMLWILLFISLAIKIPIFPFHIWLPEAHVEAPTEGSVLLAGVLLKLGTYGMIRFLFGIFPIATTYYSPIILLMSILSIFYTSLTTLRQIDIKRVIAYSSISHMNMCIVGLAMLDTIGITGSIVLMIGHGFVSGALFFMVGMLYERFHTKLIRYYSGLVHAMPIFSAFFFFFTISNMSMPGTSNFTGEFLIITSIINKNHILTLLICLLGIFIGSIYSIWLYNKLIFSLINKATINYVKDLNFKDITILIPLVVYTLWLGIYPTTWTNEIYACVPYLIEYIY